MRTVLAFLVSPLFGLGVFALVWAAPLLPRAGQDPELLPKAWGLLMGWALPAYPLVLVLSIPLYLEIRASLGWNGWTTVLAAVAIYFVVFPALGMLWVDFGALLGAWTDWLGLLAAALVHAGIFLGVAPPHHRDTV